MDKITGYELLSKIFVFSQNPEVRLISREFFEISTLDSIRADFLLYKFGKVNVFGIKNHYFRKYPNLFKKQDLVLQLLKKGASLDSKSKQILFNISVDRGWIEVSNYFLNLFHQIRKEKFEHAIENRNVETDEEISVEIKTGMKYYIPEIDINDYEENFELAVYNKQIDIVKILLNAFKIKPKLESDESNVGILQHPKVAMSDLDSKKLCDLLEEGGLELLKLFFINNFDQDTTDEPIFSEFCSRGNMKFVKFFIENGADVDEDDSTPLKLAIENKHLDVVKYLIQRGAETSKCKDLKSFLSKQNEATGSANTPVKKKPKINANVEYALQEASSNGCLDIVKNLVENGVDIHEDNETALKEACENGYLDIVKYLVENGADIHADQDWSLGMASKSGHLDVVKYLVEKGANVQARENFALGIACRNQHLYIVVYLIESGADIKAESYWRNIFEEKNKHLDVLDYLIERGLKYNYRDSSILGNLCERKTLDIVNSHIGNRIDVNTDDGNSLKQNSFNENFDIIKYLVEKGADVHADDDEAVRIASENGYYDIVVYLFEKGADIHAEEDYALRMAGENGHFDTVKYLVEKGADIHAEDDEVLKIASGNGHLHIVKFLVEKGADIHAEDDEALRMASRDGHLDIVKYLVEKGADIHAEDDENLRIASRNGHFDIIKYLVEKGFDIRVKNDRALRMASGNGHLDIVKYLVEKGADIHTEEDYALRMASQNGHLDMVKYLTDKGADIQVNSDEPLRIASENGHLDVVKHLVERGSDIHAEDDEALKMAIEYGHLDVVKYLVEKGVDIHTDSNRTLRIASENGNLDVVKYLVEKGVDIHAEDDEALKMAVEYDHLDVVKYLVEKGADIHAEDDRVLRYASKNENLDVVKFLVENGANIHAKNDYALRRACKNKSLDMVKYLVEKENEADLDSLSDEQLFKMVVRLPIVFPIAMIPIRIPEFYYKMKNKTYPDHLYYALVALGSVANKGIRTPEEKEKDLIYIQKPVNLLKLKTDIRSPYYLWTCVIIMNYFSTVVNTYINGTAKKEELEFRRRVFCTFYSADRVNLPENDFWWKYGGECKVEHPEIIFWNHIANSENNEQFSKYDTKNYVKTTTLLGKISTFAKRRWLKKAYNPDDDNLELVLLIDKLNKFEEAIVKNPPIDFNLIKEACSKYRDTIRFTMDTEHTLYKNIFTQLHFFMKSTLYQTEMVRVEGIHMHPGRIVSAKNICVDIAKKQIDSIYELNEVLPLEYRENLTIGTGLMSAITCLNCMNISPENNSTKLANKMEHLKEVYLKHSSYNEIPIIFLMYLDRLSTFINKSHKENEKSKTLFEDMKKYPIDKSDIHPWLVPKYGAFFFVVCCFEGSFSVMKITDYLYIKDTFTTFLNQYQKPETGNNTNTEPIGNPNTFASQRGDFPGVSISPKNKNRESSYKSNYDQYIKYSELFEKSNLDPAVNYYYQYMVDTLSDTIIQDIISNPVNNQSNFEPQFIFPTINLDKLNNEVIRLVNNKVDIKDNKNTAQYDWAELDKIFGLEYST
ncbi:hypothetical protein BB559_005798 [Furculomyces boomerangus]|uniref:Uncharacterized protein n=1 Tax=Furculomyces boomerangus TaxID=61424 RepID=A0A2T9Y6M9_9FUNG|nr:hypothetical protein BB559_005798 [Furculomyces boomerangus]